MLSFHSSTDFNISPQKSKFASNLQPHCRLSDSCLKEGGSGRGARHLCLLEKPLLLSPVSLSLSQQFIQNSSGAKTKPNPNVIALRQPAVQNGLERSHHKCHFFLPSFLPSPAGYSFQKRFLRFLASPFFSFFRAGDDRFPQVPLPSSLYLIPPPVSYPLI